MDNGEWQVLRIKPKMTVADLKAQLENLNPRGIVNLFDYLDDSLKTDRATNRQVDSFRIPIIILASDWKGFADNPDFSCSIEPIKGIVDARPLFGGRT